MKPYFIFIAVFLLAGLTSSSPTYVWAETEIAQPGTGLYLAQSKSVQKAVQKVETSVDGLVTARDENISNDLGLRIDAFKKVIDLSLSEAKDLQIRALLIEKDPKEMALWRDAVLAKIEEAIRHFELLKKKGVAHIKDLQAVKTEAEGFRDWREINYTPALQAVNDYSSIKRARDIIAIAKERAQKIAKDMAKLGKSGTQAMELQSRLMKAGARITEGEKHIKAGKEIFWTLYILPITASSSPTSSSTTYVVVEEEASSSTTPLLAPQTTSTNTTATSSSSLFPEAEPLPLSIKDLVRSSFDEVKGAYQIFIEMSGFVRKSP
ncbi:MAG: hypothetical protein Q8R20_03250 [Nanoarchaeota archaeon]|nr:hypothetical protein [Nanoarchaeota archaeon]